MKILQQWDTQGGAAAAMDSVKASQNLTQHLMIVTKEEMSMHRENDNPLQYTH